MESLYEETKRILRKHGITANKKLGQNFLIDPSVVDRITEIADIRKEDLVIEIGPGLGTLTKQLLKKAKKVIAIELDERMITLLQERFFMNSNFEILHQDVLKVNLSELIQKEKKENNIPTVKIVANLPYYITTPILMKLLEEKLEIESITVMIQKEVADRLCSTPGEKLAGAITYRVYDYAMAEKVFTVPSQSFLPQPEVESEVIKLIIRENPLVQVKNEKKLFELIKASFMQRRKTLANGLINMNMLKNKEEVYQMFETLQIDPKVRGENLTLEQFAKMADYIEDKNSHKKD